MKCTFCEAGIDPFENIEPDEWTIVTPLEHDDSYECERGCEEVSKINTEIVCAACGEEVNMICTYVQPCNANGYPLTVDLKKPMIQDMTKSEFADILEKVIFLYIEYEALNSHSEKDATTSAIVTVLGGLGCMQRGDRKTNSAPA